MRPRLPASALLLFGLSTAAAAQSPGTRLVAHRGETGLPAVAPNDNLTPAGRMEDGVRVVRLSVQQAEWHPEHHDGPGLVVAAFAEEGRPPSVPAPLLRVEEGTRLRVLVRNDLPDSTITLVGLATRPMRDTAGVPLRPGQERWFDFDPGAPGTYMYQAEMGVRSHQDDEEQEQLIGALVVDPRGGSPPDRVFVMNIFGVPVDTSRSPTGFLEIVAINGLSWPATERLRPTVGDTLRWRVVNATRRAHPMHLHGFYFDVLALGNRDSVEQHFPAGSRKVVTERMPVFGTMDLAWVPTRPGNWLFHCHIIFHVSSEIRLPGTHVANHDGPEGHMSGLVLGIEVAPGATTDLAPHVNPRRLRMVAVADRSDTSRVERSYLLDTGDAPGAPGRLRVPGPALVLTRGEPTEVTVVNALSEPTGVHWHGLELESWSDGVPGWSGQGDQLAPSIAPGDSFVARLTLQRPGTFIYHTHLNDFEQLTSGMYGAILVLEPGQQFDPATDHTWIFGMDHGAALANLVVNGDSIQPPLRVRLGQQQRLRVVNIMPAGVVPIQLLRDGEPVEWTMAAKDGALKSPGRPPEPARTRLDVGETVDFLWTPTEPGRYELRLGPKARYLVQEIEVRGER